MKEVQAEWKDHQPLKKTAWRQSYYTKHDTNILHLHHFRPPPQQDTTQGAAWSCRLCDNHINTRKQSSLSWHHPVSSTISSLRARNEGNKKQKYLKFPQYIYIFLQSCLHWDLSQQLQDRNKKCGHVTSWILHRQFRFWFCNNLLLRMSSGEKNQEKLKQVWIIYRFNKQKNNTKSEDTLTLKTEQTPP